MARCVERTVSGKGYRLWWYDGEMKHSWTVLLLGLAVSCATMPSTNLRSQTFLLTQRNGHYISVGYMDGSEVDLCWDTGAAMSVFDASTKSAKPQIREVPAER